VSSFEKIKIIRCGRPKEYLQTGGVLIPAYYIAKRKESPILLVRG